MLINTNTSDYLGLHQFSNGLSSLNESIVRLVLLASQSQLRSLAYNYYSASNVKEGSLFYQTAYKTGGLGISWPLIFGQVTWLTFMTQTDIDTEMKSNGEIAHLESLKAGVTCLSQQHRSIKRHTSFTVNDILSPTKFTRKLPVPADRRPNSVLDQTDLESGRSCSPWFIYIL